MTTRKNPAWRRGFFGRGINEKGQFGCKNTTIFTPALQAAERIFHHAGSDNGCHPLTSSVLFGLRHAYAEEPIEQAINLTSFLQESINMLLCGDGIPSDSCRRGLDLTFDLLIDKLRIASGELQFPLSSSSSDTESVLWSPEPETAEDAE